MPANTENILHLHCGKYIVREYHHIVWQPGRIARTCREYARPNLLNQVITVAKIDIFYNKIVSKDNVKGVAQSDEPAEKLSPESAAHLHFMELHSLFQLIV